MTVIASTSSIADRPTSKHVGSPIGNKIKNAFSERRCKHTRNHKFSPRVNLPQTGRTSPFRHVRQSRDADIGCFSECRDVGPADTLGVVVHLDHTKGELDPLKGLLALICIHSQRQETHRHKCAHRHTLRHRQRLSSRTLYLLSSLFSLSPFSLSVCLYSSHFMSAVCSFLYNTSFRECQTTLNNHYIPGRVCVVVFVMNTNTFIRSHSLRRLFVDMLVLCQDCIRRWFRLSSLLWSTSHQHHIE